MAVPNRRLAALALAASLALAAVHTWPLAASPGTLSRNDNADTLLNEWIVAWVGHQAVRDPLHLFDANIFHPEPRALAFSEHMVVQGAMGAPLSWMGASPVLVYNVLVIAGFALSAWSLWMVVWRWTGSAMAGVVAGLLFAFNAHTLTRLPHLQALHLEFLPVALWAFDQLIDRRRVRDAVWLGVAAALQGLTSNYLLVFMAVTLVAASIVRAPEWMRTAPARTAALLGLAACLMAAITGPFLLPYALAQQHQGLTRLLDEVALYSATWRDYLATAGRLHYALWSVRFAEGTTALFPGIAALALALYGVTLGRGLADARVRTAAAMGLAGVALSFGPALPGDAALYRWIPVLHGVRGAARFGFLGLAAVAILAGFGLAALSRRFGARRWWPVAAAALVLAVNLEALRAPISYRPFGGIPRIYATLADPRVTAVAEFPLPSPAAITRNAPYVLNSTAHWKPIVNGYSGLVPPRYAEYASALGGFPDNRARDELLALGVSHVVVHLDAYGEARPALAAALAETPWLEMLAAEDAIRVYALRSSPGAMIPPDVTPGRGITDPED